jgi:hypothetical protein
MERYYGSRFWQYSVPQDGTIATGRIELPNAGNGYREDEAYIRFLLRQRLGVNRLPKGTIVNPARPPAGIAAQEE